jgi:hypothetical protein
MRGRTRSWDRGSPTPGGRWSCWATSSWSCRGIYLERLRGCQHIEELTLSVRECRLEEAEMTWEELEIASRNEEE